MTTYTSNLTLADAAAMLHRTPKGGTIVILTHGKPDGDAFGSVIALAAALKLLGHDVSPWFVPPVPTQLLQLPGADLAHTFNPDRPADVPADATLYVVLDTGAWSQVGPLRATIEPHLDRTLIVDHHLSGDIPAAHRHVDGTAAACAELVGELVENLFETTTHPATHAGTGSATPGPHDRRSPESIRLRHAINVALFTGIASDTGWFRFSNTSPRTHRLAAALIEKGVDHAELYQMLEQNERPQKLLLICRALGGLELLADGQAALMVLRRKDFAETGALEQETERIVDVPQQVGDVQVVCLVTEKPARGDAPATTSISFRSKPGTNAVNVAELAGKFGGGGHARAAGAKLPQPADDVLPRIREAITQILQTPKNS